MSPVQNVSCAAQNVEPGHLINLNKFAICIILKVVVDNLAKGNKIQSGFLDIQVTINVGQLNLERIVHVQSTIGKSNF